MYGGLKVFLTESAERMPEEHYGFRPTPEVRSFGEIVGHAADAQYRFCSMVLGEAAPTPNIEKTKKTKPELVAALREAIAYCDRAYNGLTDAHAADVTALFGGMPKLGVLTVNGLHTALHYGNLITYMRLKQVVPPSSDVELMSKLRKQ
jgi:uncharacterized damage-inducible protein DinB